MTTIRSLRCRFPFASVICVLGMVACHPRGASKVNQLQARRAPALTLELPALTGYPPFDSIDLPEYDRFWNEWHLVTVRYRTDNGEQRFIYANSSAWQAMRDGTPYPDGAMFGKVAFLVSDDPAFPNSREPRGFTRLQLMRKDRQLYRATNGWGYAIYTAGLGIPYAATEATVSACHACHTIVRQRDFVFSTPSFLGDGYAPPTTSTEALKSRFRDQTVSDLTAFERSALQRVLGGDSLPAGAIIRALRMNLFPGSVNESVGAVSRFATQDHGVYALWDDQHGHFVVARALPPQGACQARARYAMTLGIQVGDRPGPGAELTPTWMVRSGTTCDGVLQ